MTGVVGIGKAIEIEIDVLKKPLFRTELGFAGTDRVVIRTPLQNDVSQYRYKGRGWPSVRKRYQAAVRLRQERRLLLRPFRSFDHGQSLNYDAFNVANIASATKPAWVKVLSGTLPNRLRITMQCMTTRLIRFDLIRPGLHSPAPN